MTMSFKKDEGTRKTAEAYAKDTVEYAKKHFKLTLDWKDSSIDALEKMFADLDIDRAQAPPSVERTGEFAKMFGSYVGEVYRRNHGATWGLITRNGETIPGLQAKDGKLFWPWGAVQGRLIQGHKDSIAAYYKMLVQRKVSG
jgi:hypothetical protein